jgi:hypothetical protein
MNMVAFSREARELSLPLIERGRRSLRDGGCGREPLGSGPARTE